MQTLQTEPIDIVPSVKKVEAGRTNLAYIEQGAGEPVIFIHGASAIFALGSNNPARFPNITEPSPTAVAITSRTARKAIARIIHAICTRQIWWGVSKRSIS